MTSDGFVNLVDAESLVPLSKPKKLHNMVVSNVVFREDSNEIITSGLDFRYRIVSLSSFSAFNEIKKILMCMAIVILVLLYFIDYLV